jgi:hypothetical protein
MTSYNPFYDDVKSRKSEASGARHRVGGSKSKKCSLPSDHLTDAQKRKLNGPVRAYNVKTPMSWDEFKSMPTDLQQAHVAFLQDAFGVSGNDIAISYFGVTGAALRLHAKNHGLDLISRQGRGTETGNLERFVSWFSGEPAPALEEARVEFPADPKPAFVVKSHSADISGSHNDLLLYIHSMLGGRSADVHIEIKFKEEN